MREEKNRRRGFEWGKSRASSLNLAMDWSLNVCHKFRLVTEALQALHAYLCSIFYI